MASPASRTKHPARCFKRTKSPSLRESQISSEIWPDLAYMLENISNAKIKRKDTYLDRQSTANVCPRARTSAPASARIGHAQMYGQAAKTRATMSWPLRTIRVPCNDWRKDGMKKLERDACSSCRRASARCA